MRPGLLGYIPLHDVWDAVGSPHICWRNEGVNEWTGSFQFFPRPEHRCLSSQTSIAFQKEGHPLVAVLVTFHLKYVPEMPVWGGVRWNAAWMECLLGQAGTWGRCCHLVDSIWNTAVTQAAFAPFHFSQRNLDWFSDGIFSFAMHQTAFPDVWLIYLYSSVEIVIIIIVIIIIHIYWILSTVLSALLSKNLLNAWAITTICMAEKGNWDSEWLHDFYLSRKGDEGTRTWSQPVWLWTSSHIMF